MNRGGRGKVQSHEQFIRLLDYEKMFNLSIMERDMDRVINTINKKEGLPTPYAPLWRNALHINAFLFPIEKVNEVVIQQIKNIGSQHYHLMKQI